MKETGILHNAEPLVPRAMRVCTMDNGEGYVQCLWCPCRFSNIADFNAHVKAFGRTEEKHKENWKHGIWRPEARADSESF